MNESEIENNYLVVDGGAAPKKIRGWITTEMYRGRGGTKVQISPRPRFRRITSDKKKNQTEWSSIDAKQGKKNRTELLSISK